ncbi:universal stress protein [bacterium]|nr:universal stress protein [bacterium]
MLRKILVAYDGSKSAARAFDFALELARQFSADLIVLSVARPPDPPTMVETSAMLDSATEHFERQFVAFRAAAEAAAVVMESRVVVGHPAEQIVHMAAEEKADLIVMGHRGKSVMERWLLGSVSKRVLSYAPCSVTVVR